jgi:hypothetical protein
MNGSHGVVGAAHHPRDNQNRKAVLADERTSLHDS